MTECEPGDHAYEVAPNGKLLKCTFCGKLAVPEARPDWMQAGKAIGQAIKQRGQPRDES